MFFFNIDSIGKACDVIIENKIDAFIGNEIKRMLLFLKFKKQFRFRIYQAPTLLNLMFQKLNTITILNKNLK